MSDAELALRLEALADSLAHPDQWGNSSRTSEAQSLRELAAMIKRRVLG